ncbi:hypothetical protein BDM02DRAFT_936188 [Thelephora ganbajun]|uniref:Uncharacterized protein n=1 Tax=Thelephora ganbajun TaxID=370292 RepID=A0ACB6Z4S9_THEGA|nr:hypothetical protein BDM02DRAFT_936188 [Thelephora ganbajun]
MNHLFDKKPKKSPKPSQKRNFLGIPTNVGADPLGFQAELDIGPDDERRNKRSRIAFQDNSGEDKKLSAPEVSTSGVAVGGTEHRNYPTRENATDTGKGEGEGKPAKASKVPERDYKSTALTAATILFDVPMEAADEFGPLGSLKAVLRTIAAVYASHQETVAIGNKIEDLLSRIVALEEHFYSRPDDVEEQRRRNNLIREFSRIEGQLRSLSLRSLSRDDLLNMFKTTNKFMGSSKIYGGLSLITRFVHDPGSLVCIDGGNRWRNEW